MKRGEAYPRHGRKGSAMRAAFEERGQTSGIRAAKDKICGINHPTCRVIGVVPGGVCAVDRDVMRTARTHPSTVAAKTAAPFADGAPP